MKRGDSTFCCCPLIAYKRRRANLSTAGEARSSRPLTWAVGSATRCELFGENNSVQVGQNFQNQLPDNLAGGASPTSVQLGQKLKTPLLCKLQRSHVGNFDTTCVEVAHYRIPQIFICSCCYSRNIDLISIPKYVTGS